MHIRLTLSLLILSLFSPIMARTWTNNKGQQLEAELISTSATEIIIRSSRNGQKYTYQISDLSTEDQQYLAQLQEEQAKLEQEKKQQEEQAEYEKKLKSRRAKWTESHEEALAQAKEYNLPIFMLFTGSEWCGYCIKLEDEVLSDYKFKKYANQNLVLLKLDFPAQLDKASEEQRALKKKYGTSGFPTVWLTDTKGDKIAKIPGYGGDSAKEYIETVDTILQ